jgi:hypothetical protein
VDREQLERFEKAPVVLLDPGVYTLRIEEVEVAENGLSLRPLCIVVGGDDSKVCPETYDFSEGGENRDAILNLYGWGVSEAELTETGGDLKSIGGLLVGRIGRVELQQSETETSGAVNTHRPGAIEPVAQQ